MLGRQPRAPLVVGEDRQVLGSVGFAVDVHDRHRNALGE
jgi:hypothetical protein